MTLNPLQQYMLRLLLWGAGKTILRKGSICEVTDVHDTIRRLCPLINPDLSEAKSVPFWVPRPRARKQVKAERVWSGRLHQTLRTWEGERQGEAVALPSNFPSSEYLLMLVQDLGYERSAALSALSRAHIWRDPRPDRKRNGQPFTVLHPYRSAAPTRRTLIGGGFTKAQVMKAVSQMKTRSHKMRQAMLEIVYRRQPPKEISKKLKLNWGMVRVYATRVRQRLKEEAA